MAAICKHCAAGDVAALEGQRGVLVLLSRLDTCLPQWRCGTIGSWSKRRRTGTHAHCRFRPWQLPKATRMC